MKVKASITAINQNSTTTTPNKFRVEVVATGNEWDAEQFYKHIAKYEQLKQTDFTEEYYKGEEE